MGLTGLTRFWQPPGSRTPGNVKAERQVEPWSVDTQGWTTWFLCQVNYEGKSNRGKRKEKRPGLCAGASGHGMDCVNTRRCAVLSVGNPYPENLNY